MKLNILGTEYTIEERTTLDDPELKRCDGYCDKTTKLIVIQKNAYDSNLGNFDIYKKKVLRHEILHAFLYESGLHENFSHPQYGHDETYLDWFAIQFPKILEAYKQCACIL